MIEILPGKNKKGMLQKKIIRNKTLTKTELYPGSEFKFSNKLTFTSDPYNLTAKMESVKYDTKQKSILRDTADIIFLWDGFCIFYVIGNKLIMKP